MSILEPLLKALICIIRRTILNFFQMLNLESIIFQKNIKKQFKNLGNFSFRVASLDEVKKVIQDLKNNKSTGGEIPISKLKGCEFTFKFLRNCINKLIKDGSFPDSLKEANTLLFSK